jgi:alpha/beta superfamily hydrolase
MTGVGIGEARRRLIDGPSGKIEVALDWPAAAPVGAAFIGHPHPLYGGTLDNKVASTLARAFVALGWLAVRPNFRGVGRSEGTHDEGRGETADFLHVVRAVPALDDVAAALAPGRPLALAGFSFGSFVAARAASELAAAKTPPDHLVLIGAAAGKWDMPRVPPGTLVIHGEHDETIPLAAVLDWARPQDLPVVVLPGSDHFFHHRVTLLKDLVIRHVGGAPCRKPAASEASIDASGQIT